MKSHCNRRTKIANVLRAFPAASIPPGHGGSHRSGERALHLIRINQQCNMSKILRSQENTFLENVGLVRFELTIDGSLRHASVLQRVIINSADPLFIICEHERTQRPLEPVAIPGLATTPHVMLAVNMPQLTVQDRADEI